MVVFIFYPKICGTDPRASALEANVEVEEAAPLESTSAGSQDYHRSPINICIRYEECVGTCLLAVYSLACSTFLYFSPSLHDDRGVISHFGGVDYAGYLVLDNIQLLRQRYYYETWKADRTRYMMLINVDGCYD
ncbi:hypothetical protein F8388_021661 [Cannabis sativa]|uniref:mRNA capping enzyme adenylation domain-containing protein n=1 Tax=Cannabis sativa TaxID=3483 RepID=A0A7J6DXX4_CANSA|nr:hypothetical protein F8388_021661 [Cannabis sativa]